jgi:hypothetical protein
MSARGRLAWLIAALALSPLSVVAQDAEKPKPSESAPDKDADVEVDDELLEFLGSVGSEDEEMIDYLSKSDELPAEKPTEQFARPTTTRPRSP